MTTTITRRMPAEDADANRAADALVDALDRINPMRPGETITYHDGFVGKDREKCPEIANTAAAFMKLADAGRVVLTQLRLGDERFLYRATKAR